VYLDLAAGSRAEGLSREEIKAVANELGIDPPGTSRKLRSAWSGVWRTLRDRTDIGESENAVSP